jgi:hypothetical protein
MSTCRLWPVALLAVAVTPALAAEPDLLQKINDLAKQTKADDPAVRARAAEELGREQIAVNQAARALCEMLAQEKDMKARQAALLALREVRPSLFSAVAALTSEKQDDPAQDKAIFTLKELGKDGAPAAPAIRAYMRHVAAGQIKPAPSINALQRGAEALIVLEPSAQDTVDAVFALVRRPIRPNRGDLTGLDLAGRTEGLWALRSLCRVRRDVHPAAVKLVRDVLNDTTVKEAILLAGVRRVSIIVLRDCGPAAKDALPELKALLLDESEAIRKEADVAIKDIEGR